MNPEPASMVEGLSGLLEGPDLRDELGKRGRELVVAEYSRERFAVGLTTFYERMERKVRGVTEVGAA